MTNKNDNPKKKRQRKAVVKTKSQWWKRFDKILNVVVIIVLLLWIAGKLIDAPEPEPEKTIEEQASNLFSKKQEEISSQVNSTLNTDKTSKLNPINNIKHGIIPLTADIIDGAIAKTNEKPLILFVYASWCPYCKKQFPLIDNIARNKTDKYNVLAVSIDKKTKDLTKYIDSLYTPPAFITYSTNKTKSMKALYASLQRKDLQFKGAVPYMVIFWQGKSQAELRGFLEEDKFKEILGDLDKFVEKQK